MGSVQVVLAYPTEKEEVTKQFFEDGLTKWMKAMIHETGHNPRAMGWHYLIPEYCSDKEDEEELFLKYKESFAQKLCALPADCTVILAVGRIPKEMFQIEGDLLKVRGSVYTWERNGRLFYVVPTFDPHYLVSGNTREVPTFYSDIDKVFRIGREGWKPTEEKFDMFLEWEALKERLVEIARRGAMISCDLETTSLNPRNAKIIVLGIAENEEQGFSVPLLCRGGELCWTREQYKELNGLLQAVFDNCATLWQNAAYDIAVLKLKGFTFKKEIHDTMLMHHTYHVELPHGLGYIASVYADTPYWKDDVLKNPQDMINIEDGVLRKYNLRDCVVLWPIYRALETELKAQDTWKIYDRVARRLVHPVTELEINGMHIIGSRLVEWKKTLEREVEEWSKKFVEVAELPDCFNANGKIHLSWLFLGIKPSGADAKFAEYEKYLADDKKRKDTKKFKELENYVRVFREVKPFPRLKGQYLRTKTGGYDLGAQGLVKMRLMANKEIEDIEALKRENPEKESRRLELLRFVKVIGFFGELKKWIKLASTYGDFPVGSDGRIHPKYNIAGTRTGRLSSSGPNWQNLPPIVKRLFGPEKGKCFIEADFSNIEMRTLSYESGDTVLQEQFRSGKKIHKENTKVLFGLSEDDDPENENSIYKKMYKCAKTYIFGRGYGGSLKGIYERVLLQVPGIDLKYGDFVKADEAYRAEHPRYVEWAARTVKNAVESKCLTTAFGRKRWFLDDDSMVARECLNTPNQSVAADVFNVALIGIQNWIDQEGKGVKLVGAVHDSIIVECGVDQVERVAALMRQVMEQEFDLWGQKVSFPVEFKVGTKSWAELEKYEVEARDGSDNRGSDIETTGEEQWFFDWGTGD